MDAHERELERAAIGGDRDAQTQLRELWRRTGRDLLPVHAPRAGTEPWWTMVNRLALWVHGRDVCAWSERDEMSEALTHSRWGGADPLFDAHRLA